MKNFKIWRTGLLGAAAFCALSAPVLTAPAHADILIGLATGLSGGTAALGEQVKQGFTKAVDDINAAGGIKGQKLVVEIADDACDPKQAVSVANQLVNKKVVAVIGHLCSGATIPASDVYAEEGIVMISSSATNPLVTAKKYPTVFRTVGRDDQQGPVAAELILSKFAGKKVAILHDKQAYGQGLADATKASLNAKGVTEVFYGSITAGENDYSSLVSRLKAAGAEVLYYGGYHKELGLIARQAKSAGLPLQFIAGDGLNEAEYWQIAGDAAEGTLFTFPADPGKTPEGAKVAAGLKEKGYAPTGFALNTYVAMQALARGLTDASAPKGVEIAKALHAAGSISTILGPIAFDEKGDLTKPAFDIFVWSKGAAKPQS